MLHKNNQKKIYFFNCKLLIVKFFDLLYNLYYKYNYIYYTKYLYYAIYKFIYFFFDVLCNE